MLRLTEWMAEYYLCPWGQVLEAVVPGGVRGQAGTRQTQFVSLPNRVAARLAHLKLTPTQQRIVDYLAGRAAPAPIAAGRPRRRLHGGPDPDLAEERARRVRIAPLRQLADRRQSARPPKRISSSTPISSRPSTRSRRR